MKRLYALFFISLCWFGFVHATTLHVEQLSGTDYAMAVKQIGKLIIKGTTLEFYDRQGEKLYTSDIQTVSALTFDKSSEKATPPGSDEEDDDALEQAFHGDSERYVAYPNPTSTMIIVKGLSEETTLRLYSLDGHMIKKTVGTSIGVEELPNGNYLLQCENQIIKIIKQ